MSLSSMFGLGPKPKAPEIMQRFDPNLGDLAEYQARKRTEQAMTTQESAAPLNMIQLMTSGQPKRGPMDDPWRRALFSAGASMLDSSGRSVGSAFGRAVNVGLDTYDAQRQLQAQAAATDRERQIEEALAQAKLAEMNGARAKDERMQKARAGLLEEFKLTADMSPEQRQVTLSNLMMKALSIGDTGVAGAISQAIQAMGGGSKAKEPELKEIRKGNETLLVNPMTGEIVQRFKIGLAPKQPGSGGDGVAGSGGKPTEMNLKAAGFVPRMTAANEALEGIETSLTQALTSAPNGLVASNFLETPEGRQTRVLGEGFIMGLLRLESGAVLGDPEMLRYQRQYLPQPGDDKATLELKRRMRVFAIEQARSQAGPAKITEAEKGAFILTPTVVPAAVSDAARRYPKR